MIEEISIDRTNDEKKFDRNGKNWIIILKFNNKKFGIELKPEMNLFEIIIEFIKFMNLLTREIDK